MVDTAASLVFDAVSSRATCSCQARIFSGRHSAASPSATGASSIPGRREGTRFENAQGNIGTVVSSEDSRSTRQSHRV